MGSGLFARALLREASAELARLRRIRGAHRRTARRIAAARGLLAAAAGLLGAPLGAAAAPRFASPFDAFGLRGVESRSAPAFADVDGDGDLDVFLGESLGATLFFENTGTAGAPAFGAPSVNPLGLTGVGGLAAPAFADIDGDGDLDAWIGAGGGETSFFENTGTASAPAFLSTATLPFGLTDVGNDASPAFADLDGDGDLDGLFGRSAGGVVWFENTGTASAPAFAASSTGPFGLAAVGGTSSGPGFADLDDDGDLDALIGTQLNLSFLENTGSAAAPAFGAPASAPFGIDNRRRFRPAFGDLEGDGDLDLLLGFELGQLFFFENTGTAVDAAFSSAAVPPAAGLPAGGIASAVPAFADLDADGDPDALVGSGPDGTLFYHQNTGGAASPAFADPVSLPFGLADIGSDPAPALADIDGDGDFDAFVGGYDGDTSFFENTGTAAAPAFAAPSVDPFGPTNVVGNARPAFADIDGDGDLDGFTGDFFGNTSFFTNTGTALAPALAATSTNPFGLTSVGVRSAPAFADVDGDGDFDALIGSSDGTSFFFENTGTAAAPAFAAPAIDVFGLGTVGLNSSPAFVDVDGDGDADAFLGAYDSVSYLFRNTSADCPAAPAPACVGFARGRLAISEKIPGREKLSLELRKGPALAQGDLGDPLEVGGTGYGLCVFDDAGARAAGLAVDRPGDACGEKPCWKALGAEPPAGKGYRYKDKTAASDGLKALVLTAGAAGKSTLTGAAANNETKGQSALPTGIAAALAGTASATLQLRTSDAGCFSTTLSEIQKSTPTVFKAR